MEFTVRHLKKTDSTNLEIKRAALGGAPEGLCVIADSQSAGTGRLGRRFFSPGGTGLYMSLLLRPPVPPEPQLVTCAAAAAVCAALEKRGFRPGIKWVNDVLIGSRKVCGILAQSVFEGSECFTVLGVGVNLAEPEGGFPEEIKSVAGALYKNSRDVPQGLRDGLAGEILENFASLYEVREGSRERISEEYVRRSVMPGKRVSVIMPDSVFSATCAGVNADLSLSVVTDVGEKLSLRSGEVSLKLL